LKNRKGTALALLAQVLGHDTSLRQKPETALLLVSADHPLQSFQAPATATAATSLQ